MGDVPDLSRIRAGRVTLQHERFDLLKLLATLRHARAPLAQAKGLVFR